MSFSVTILGSSSATPTSRRNPSAQVLNMDGKLFLIDCGEGTQIQLRRFRIRFQRIHHIFITHLHGDHYLGLMGLLQTMHLLGKTSVVNIYGPENLKPIILEQLALTDSFINYELVFNKVNFNQLECVYEDDKLTVESFPLDHRVNCAGYIFKEKKRDRKLIKKEAERYGLTIEDIVKVKKGESFITKEGKEIKSEDLTTPTRAPRSYAYCSDTAYKEDIVPIVKGVDLLYHEATFMNDMEDRAASTKHSTAMQAAKIARQAKVSKLVLGHFSARYKDLTPLLNEAQKVFENSILASDGMTFEIE
ncbi:MAG: ribonuclease Z [Bacteroidetes bacterium]|nr:ribonuclease Z [Bacteroidota bacterium]